MTTNLASFSDSNRKFSLSSQDEVDEVCIANISPRERRKRLNFAIWQFIMTLIILGVLMALDLNPFWRLPLFFLFSASTVSFFQVLDKT